MIANFIEAVLAYIMAELLNSMEDLRKPNNTLVKTADSSVRIKLKTF
jgi:hypothetical protein